MQEEANEKTVAIAVQGGKMTARLFGRAVEQFLRYRHDQKQFKKRDPTNYKMNQPKKIQIKKLVKEGAGVSSIELKDDNIRKFERLARKNGVRYAIKKDRSTNPPTYLIFFKGKDAEVIDATLREYTKRQLKKTSRPVIHEKLTKYAEMAREAASKLVKHRSKEQVR